MKARTDCQKCRKAIYKEAETAYLQHEYKFFEESAYSMAYFAFCGIFTSLIRKGRTKKYIKSLWDDMCFVFSMPNVFGKQFTMTDTMKRLEKDYGIEWQKLQLNIESEREFIHGVQKGRNK